MATARLSRCTLSPFTFAIPLSCRLFLFIGGLSLPLSCAAAGTVYNAGRYFYAKGYYGGNPHKGLWGCRLELLLCGVCLYSVAHGRGRVAGFWSFLFPCLRPFFGHWFCSGPRIRCDTNASRACVLFWLNLCVFCVAHFRPALFSRRSVRTVLPHWGDGLYRLQDVHDRSVRSKVGAADDASGAAAHGRAVRAVMPSVPFAVCDTVWGRGHFYRSCLVRVYCLALPFF